MFERLTFAHIRLYAVALIAIFFMGEVAWDLIQPFSWISVPVLIVFVYATFRLLFEMTFNRKNIPTLATAYFARQKIAAFLKEEAEKSGKKPFRIVDLGSGRGELARCIAKAIPSAEVKGLELAFFPFKQSIWMQKLFGPANLSFARADIWTFDCAEQDAVVLYLSPLTAHKMGEKLRKELKAGSVIVSHTFPLAAPWVPESTHTLSAPFSEVFYVYRKEQE